MDLKKIIATIIGIIIAFIALSITVDLLSSASQKKTSTEAVFISNPEKQTAVVNPGGVITEKGRLEFGDFALFQLTNEETSLEFIDANFGEKTKAITSARGRVNSGSVLAVNLLFGNELTLLDDRLTARNQGGSFAFEKNAELNSTRVRALSGNIEITFLDKNNLEMFEGVLLTHESVNLTDETIAEIFEAEDPIARVKKWEEEVENFSSKFDGESRLISSVLEKLPRGKINALTNILGFIKEKILFNDKTREAFYKKQLTKILGEDTENTDKINKLLATTDIEKHAQLQKAVAQITPLAHIFLTKSLAPSLKEKISQLANLSEPFSNFAETPKLSSIDELNRNLIFITNDSTNEKHVKTFLNLTQNEDVLTNTETAKLLLAIMQSDSEITNSDWLKSWETVNKNRIVTNFDLATATIDQLSLVKFFVKSGKGKLAGDALRSLVELLFEGSTKLSEASLEEIASEGNELKNQILFLALHDETEFNEEAYYDWKTEEEEAKAMASQAPRSKTVARPESEFSKFLKMDLPVSEIQITPEDEELEKISEISEEATEEIEPEEVLLME